MTKEQIWEEAEKQYGNASGTIDNMPAQWLVDEARRGYVTAATKYSALLEEKDKEIERLSQRQIEATYLLNPILEYGQGHKDIPLGGSITTHILSWAKQYHKEKAKAVELVKALEEMAKQKKLKEMTAEEIQDGDFDFAYDKFIDTAREALNTYKQQ